MSGQADSRTQDPVFALLLALIVAPALLIWVWGGIAGAIFGEGWPRANVAELAHTLLALPSHVGDPRAAWPSSLRGDLPATLPFYTALLLLVLVLTAAGLAIHLLWRRTRRDHARTRERGARWARPAELRPLDGPRHRLRPATPTEGIGARLALGFTGSRLLRAEQRHALVVFGPPQSGKSSGLAVGALLEWEGPAIASSIKNDVLQATIERRRAVGRVFVFDPFALSGARSNSWSPLGGAHTFDGALEVAHSLASAGELESRSVESGEFWAVAAEQRLGPLLYVAARTGRDIATLVRWGYGQGEQELNNALHQLLRSAETEHERRDAQAAYDAVAAFAAQPDRTRGSIEGTVQALLRAYRFARVQQSARASEITPEALFAGNNTLFLVGDAKAARLLRPIFLALLGELIQHAYEKATLNGGALRTPLLLCLDELGNVAPLPNLAEIASTAPSHNIQLVSIFHDLAQIRSRYGRDAETVINSHRARMLLPGVADLETLRYFSGLVGDELVRDETRTTGPGGQTRSENQTRRPLAPAEQLRQLPNRHALLVYGRLPPVILRLRMSFEDKHLIELSGG